MPKLRPDAQTDIQSAIYFAIHKRLETISIYRSCISCQYFDHPTEGCKLANGQRPPARIIVNGCDSWDNDEIPF